jgi:CDP-diacylglycerol--glycerol-3-phosphate 3-phosphatidyltransferase
MGFLAVVLFPLFSPPGTTIVATLFMIPFVVGFLSDWKLTSTGEEPLDAFSRVFNQPLLRRGIPLAIRTSTAGLIGLGFLPEAMAVIHDLGLGSFSFSMAASPVLWLVGMLGVGVILMVTLGVAGRVAALAALISTGVLQNYAPLDLGHILLLVSATALFFIGSGVFSIWEPERRIIQRRAGETSRELEG